MAKVPLPPSTATWRKSTASTSGACVEICREQGYVWVRDSKNPHAAVLGFTSAEWSAFLVGVARGEFG